MKHQTRWQVEFYKTDQGRSPPQEFIDSLPDHEKAKITRYIDLLEEFGTDLREPHAKPLRGEKPLWELRPMPNRLIYVAQTGRRFLILHAFTKKRNETAKRHIRTAKQRYQELMRREK